jgi:hypothetical protein
MINGAFRPWGKLQWLLGSPSLQSKEWFLIGVISTQDRCLSTLRHGKTSFKLCHAAFLEVVDEPSQFSNLSKIRRDQNREICEAETDPVNRETHVFGIFEPIRSLKRVVDSWLASGKVGNVILDVSTLPERFLFPILRWLVSSQAVENLVVTCMIPERYTHEDLAYDAQDASHLPTFANDPVQTEKTIKQVIVGVGFLPFSLPDWLKKTYSNPRSRISLIFPFPSNPDNVRKGWEFVRRVDANVSLNDDRQISRVAAYDVSGCFDRINLITSHGRSSAVYAPFGPKAHSVAMCLQALRTDAEAYFAHPSYYHPEYSTGIRLSNNLPDGNAYAIKLSGNNLYE